MAAVPVVLILLLGACGGDANEETTSGSSDTPVAPLPTAQAVAQVNLVNTTFQPQQIEVAVGTTVTWTNQDTVAHTVTAGPRDNPSGLFDSGNMEAGGTFSFTFTEPGTYEYFCSPHPGMDGTVIVTAPAG
jgi:plastocyanin